VFTRHNELATLLLLRRRKAVDTSDKPRGAPIKLRSIGNQMRAVLYRAGNPIRERKLDEGAEVWPATTGDKARDAPKENPSLAGDETTALRFTGWYIVPSDGLAAVFGAMRSGELKEYHPSEIFSDPPGA
jgi:hypothetical protein